MDDTPIRIGDKVRIKPNQMATGLNPDLEAGRQLFWPVIGAEGKVGVVVPSQVGYMLNQIDKAITVECDGLFYMVQPHDLENLENL